MADTYQAIYDAVRSRIGGCNIGEALQDAMRGSFDISYVVEGIKQDFYYTLSEYQRPSVLFKPVLGRDGTQWCALFGSNLMEGVSGFGDTPDKAMRDFDIAWHKENGSA